MQETIAEFETEKLQLPLTPSVAADRIEMEKRERSVRGKDIEPEEDRERKEIAGVESVTLPENWLLAGCKHAQLLLSISGRSWNFLHSILGDIRGRG